MHFIEYCGNYGRLSLWYATYHFDFDGQLLAGIVQNYIFYPPQPPGLLSVTTSW